MTRRALAAEERYSVLNKTAPAPTRNTTLVQGPKVSTNIRDRVWIMSAPLGSRPWGFKTAAP